MAKTRDAICGLANTWLGRNEREGTHKEIIDIYNSFAPAIAPTRALLLPLSL